jgi:hypothetical protein
VIELLQQRRQHARVERQRNAVVLELVLEPLLRSRQRFARRHESKIALGLRSSED